MARDTFLSNWETRLSCEVRQFPINCFVVVRRRFFDNAVEGAWRDLKQTRRPLRRQRLWRQRQTDSMSKTRALHVHHTFWYISLAKAWYGRQSFIEVVNIRQRIFLSFSEYLTTLASWSNRQKDWKNENSLHTAVFRRKPLLQFKPGNKWMCKEKMAYFVSSIIWMNGNCGIT